MFPPELGMKYSWRDLLVDSRSWWRLWPVSTDQYCAAYSGSIWPHQAPPPPPPTVSWLQSAQLTNQRPVSCHVTLCGPMRAGSDSQLGCCHWADTDWASECGRKGRILTFKLRSSEERSKQWVMIASNICAEDKCIMITILHSSLSYDQTFHACVCSFHKSNCDINNNPHKSSFVSENSLIDHWSLLLTRLSDFLSLHQLPAVLIIITWSSLIASPVTSYSTVNQRWRW